MRSELARSDQSHCKQNMTHPKVHIVYEYGIDTRPHSSSYIRLIRPLTHPNLSKHLETTFSPRLPANNADIVIVDRLWRPDISPSLAYGLVDDIRSLRSRMIYTLDDNILDLAQERRDWPQERHLQALRIFLQAADEVWVPTHALKERLSDLSQSVLVIPNALDERLLCYRGPLISKSLFNNQPVIIGMMGTRTHDQDLLMIAPALHELWWRYPGKFELEIIGVTEKENTLEMLSGLPVRLHNPPPEEQEYPLFQLWFSSSINWDIALAPLTDTPFNRCKSDIKFLDYSAIGAAGIYSLMPPYRSTIEQRVTGLLVENQTEAWIDALEEYLNDEHLRLNISLNARQYLHTERILAGSIDKWFEALLRVIE